MSTREKINLTQIIVTAVVTLVVTIASSMILSYLQTSEPRLVYSTTETMPFSGEDRVIGIYQISIGNEGGKATKNVVCYVCLPEATIEQWQLLADPAITYTHSLVNDTLTLNFPMLNPSEFVQLSVLATAPKSLPMRPEVSLRAEGISGFEKEPTTAQRGLEFIFVVASIGALSAGLATLFTFRRRIVGDEEEKVLEEGRHPTKGEQNRILAYLCGTHGLISEMENYLTRRRKVAYWAEADRLGVVAISSTNQTEIENIKSILKTLLEYADIAESSQGIINYNIARIEAAQGNLDEMRKYLSKARETIPKLLETRLKIDPVFKDLTTD